jgi:hypothetical protein
MRRSKHIVRSTPISISTMFSQGTLGGVVELDLAHDPSRLLWSKAVVQ